MFLLLVSAPAQAAGDNQQPPQTAPVSYDYGMEQRSRGDYAAAKETFLKLLEESPASGGALEGLSLACMSLGQYDEAAGYLEQWNTQSPHSAYILRLLARAQASRRDQEGALRAYKDMAECDPRDCVARARLDSYMERLRPGFFPYGKTYKSYSMEDLDTPNPQRILYSGASAGSRFRVSLKPGLDLIGGAEIREEAQKNDGRGFTYYDIREQVYSAGLNGRPNRDVSWEAEYGQSVLSDVEGSAVGNTLFSRARLAGAWHVYNSDLKLTLTRSPKFLRDSSGGPRFFSLLRENEADAEAGSSRWGWDWLGRAGLDNTSDGTTRTSYSLRGLRESGNNIFRSGYSHGQQEFYSGSTAGKLQYVNKDNFNVGIRRAVEELYRVGASYDYTFYSDKNRLGELNGELTGWLPWAKEFYGTYRYSLQDFRGAHAGYNSVSARAHWLGAYWRRCQGHNWSATAGYEHGFLHDVSRGNYEGNSYIAELEWYYGTSGSVRVQANRRNTTVKDRSYSVGLQARYSFR